MICGTGRARSSCGAEEAGRTSAVVDRDATVGSVEVEGTGDAGAGEGRFPRGGRVEAGATPRCTNMRISEDLRPVCVDEKINLINR